MTIGNAALRVAVTGIGAVTPVGVGVEATWKSLLAGRSGAGLITHFDTSAFDVKIGCQADDFEPRDFMEARDVRRTDRFCQFAIAAAVEAIDQAGGLANYEPHRIGVIVGSGVGGLSTIEATHTTLLQRGPSKVSPFAVPLLMINGAPGAISMRWGFTGPNFSTVSACATGGHSIGEGARFIQMGVTDAMIVGGSEAGLTPLATAAFSNMGALSKRNDAPERASRPFDIDRDGFVMGEGAGILVLEEWRAAERRGAAILGEIVGYAATGDAFHLTQPHPEGIGAALAMRQTLQQAGLEPGDVGYVNAHGTSTFADKIESAAIRAVFGDAAPPVSSTKSMTGHLLGAAGAVEAIFVIQALREGQIPPTINVDNQDPDCPIDCVPGEARATSAEYGMSNSFGFGGHNACIAIRRVR